MSDAKVTNTVRDERSRCCSVNCNTTSSQIKKPKVERQQLNIIYRDATVHEIGRSKGELTRLRAAANEKKNREHVGHADYDQRARARWLASMWNKSPNHTQQMPTISKNNESGAFQPCKGTQ